jgi:hypothetical protein
MATLETELQDLMSGPAAEDGDEAGTNLAAAIEGAEIMLAQPLGLSGSGNRLHMGSGVPGSGLGSDGDYYFRTDSPHIYYKDSGSWAVMV